MPATSERAQVGVDRVLCSGHGICAQLLPANVELDEWGYPIVHHPAADAASVRLAVKLCPARALFLR